MSLLNRRYISTTSRVLQQITPAVKLDTTSKPDSKQRFEKNFPTKERTKAWEREGLDKDTYFRKKFAHVHAKSKGTPEDIQTREHYRTLRRDKKKSEEREWRSQRYEHKSKFTGGRDVYKTLKPNPLSEYIYGTSPVIAALTSKKREVFTKLYVHNPDSKSREIIKLANELKIRTQIVDSKNELNQLTDNAVHNGFVLETKPLIPSLVHSLGTVHTPIETESGSKTITTYEINEDNFGDSLCMAHETKNPHPFGLFLDSITDPHNIGAIIRTAYFLGVDFIITSSRNSSQLTPVVSKTSVGAVEFMNIMSTEKPLQFMDKSRENGWTFVSADSLQSVFNHRDSKISQTLQGKFIKDDDLNSLLQKGPVCLVLGSEGEGIRTTVKLRSDFLVEIEGNEDKLDIIDSLNVSVAAALLMQKTLK
ncbi:hypothetical protein WICPIJ_009781 [Wickerhamomyces pijperi]|uniref:rRNA methyltransferase 1, mitochondrial n=1 Tax=Wickerhamomyces pijperi TaxID=599730 RepID=A0A9P8PJE1_WICPI|nr:hypothetical protein WICPIJ_009781 [Wickerhamomyces pijperi]